MLTNRDYIIIVLLMSVVYMYVSASKAQNEAEGKTHDEIHESREVRQE